MAPGTRIERVLAVSALGVLLLGAVDLARSFGVDTLVTSDFAVFRAGSSIVLAGGDPYDVAAQEAAMREVLGVAREGGHLGFLLPPHGAMLFAPFAWAPLGVAFGLFAFLSAVLLARLVLVLADLARADVRVVALVVLALGPVHATFRLGQLAIVCALLLAELVRAVRDGNDVVAGVALGLLSLKPQFVPVALVFLAGTARWRALAVAAGTFVVIALPSLVVLGPNAWPRWVTELGALENAFAVATPPYMVSFRGVLARALGDPERRALASTLAGAVFVLVLGLSFGLGRGHRARPLRALALALAFGLFFSPHLFFHDLLAWTVPVALARGAAGPDARRAWDLLALSAPVALLVASLVEPALGFLVVLAPQLVVPLMVTERLAREVRADARAPAPQVPSPG